MLAVEFYYSSTTEEESESSEPDPESPSSALGFLLELYWDEHINFL